MDKRVKEQILKVRDSGKVNMFDINGVQRVASNLKCGALVNYIDNHRDGGYRFKSDEYVHFILYGE